MLENKYGEFWLEFNSGLLFCVIKYEGFDDKYYVCFYFSSFSLYYKGIVDGVIFLIEIWLFSLICLYWLEFIIYFFEEDGFSRIFLDGVGGDSLNMLFVVVKILFDKLEFNIKEFFIVVGLKGVIF